MNTNLGAGLEDQGVIVTGAAGGIGRATVHALAAVGARVLAVDLDEYAAYRTVADAPGTGHAALGADLTDLETHQKIIATARSELGSLKAIGHLAAVLKRRESLDEVTEDDWDLQLDVNLKASFFLLRSVANAMIEDSVDGRIVAFSSQGWWTGGFGGSVVYCASKGGIVSMIRGLSRTYGPYGITVNAVAPGLVETPMLTTDLSNEVYQRLKQQTPLGRVADPKELASVVTFLLSDHASFISGATINVSGGFLMY